MRHLPIHDIDAAQECRLLLAGFGEAGIVQHFNIPESHIREGLGRGAGVSAGHIGDAIMGHSFFDEDGIVMCGRSRCFAAAALVNGNVYQHAAAPHAAQHLPANQFRCFGSRHEHSPDEQINGGKQFHQMRFTRVKCMRRVEGDIEKAHALEIHFQDRHIRSQTLCHASGVDSRCAPAQNHNSPRKNAGHTTEQHATAAKMFRQEITAHQDRHASCDFAHWLEQG